MRGINPRPGWYSPRAAALLRPMLTISRTTTKPRLTLKQLITNIQHGAPLRTRTWPEGRWIVTTANVARGAYIGNWQAVYRAAEMERLCATRERDLDRELRDDFALARVPGHTAVELAHKLLFLAALRDRDPAAHECHNCLACGQRYPEADDWRYDELSYTEL